MAAEAAGLRGVYVGIDLAWGPRARTGLACVDSAGTLIASGAATTNEQIDAWLAEHCPSVVVAAIDAPLIVTNPTGTRDCERQLNSAFARFQAGCHPTNTGNPHMNPPRGGELARRHGWRLDPSGGGPSPIALEVYPHAAHVGLFHLPRTLKYKRGPFGQRQAELLRLLALTEGITELGLAAHVRWKQIRGHVEGATRPFQLDQVEDEVDAVICAHLAWLWGSGSQTLRLYGEPSRGAILAPNPPLKP